MTEAVPDRGEPFLSNDQISILIAHTATCLRLRAAGWKVTDIVPQYDGGKPEDVRILLTLPEGQAVIKTEHASLLLQEDVLSDDNKLLEGWTIEQNPDAADSDTPNTAIRYIGPVNESYAIGVFALAGFVEVQ